ncbi:MAG: LamG domain-containing protein [Myxococcota bacterium]|nr:LamG domain-containing protein [Myxococcota bacterium]
MMRTRDSLIGVWPFDETQGTTIPDESGLTGPGAPVPVNVTVGGSNISWNDGRMTITAPIVAQSSNTHHLGVDAQLKNAVTLEAWVQAGGAEQGTASLPAVIASLSINTAGRNIALMQIGDKWVGRARTNADANGRPELVSMNVVQTSAMTHLVLVADNNRRILYVNNVPEGSNQAGGPTGWDVGIPLVFGNEISQNGPWLGTFSLVAMYDRALTVEEIDRHYIAGPDAPY